MSSATTSSRSQVVRLGERDPELRRTIDAGQLSAHPLRHDLVAASGERIRRALGAVAVAVDADLGEQAGRLQPGDRVVERTVRDRDDSILPTLAQQPEHLVRVHLALAQQREHDDPEGRQPGSGIRHESAPFRIVHDGLYTRRRMPRLAWPQKGERMPKDAETLARAHEIFDPIADRYLTRQDVDIGPMFGSQGLRVRGKVFAFVGHLGGLVVKVPEARASELVDERVAERMVMRDRPMREWLTVGVGGGCEPVGRSDRRGLRVPRRDHAVAGRARARRASRDNGRVTSPLVLPGWRHVYSGKVRDLYVPADQPPAPAGSGETASGDTAGDRMLVVASDRVSAFDHVLEPGIPDKGVLLTTLSLWWFDRLAIGGDGERGIPNHLAADHVLDADATPAADPAGGGRAGDARAEPGDAAHRVRRARVSDRIRLGRVPAERHGVRHPSAVGSRQRRPAARADLHAAFKAPMGEHDENISYERTVELVGAERAAELRELSLEVYGRAARIAEARGLILADTKFEFGLDDAGVMTLADEVLTSDSSRYWDAAAWDSGSTPAERMASFDKQIVRDWLAANWDQHRHARPAFRRRSSSARRTATASCWRASPPEECPTARRRCICT